MWFTLALALLFAVQVCSFGRMRTDLQRNVAVKSRSSLHMGYVPPEQDPEYRPIMKKSLIRPSAAEMAGIDEEALAALQLPVPKEGDIVASAGKWEGEPKLGKIRFLRYSNSSSSWIVDIVPLMAGKSEDVYVVNRNGKSYYENLQDIKPVYSYFLRNENGFKLTYKNNGTMPILKGETYRDIESTYELPKKTIDKSVLEGDMVAYEQIKSRIVLNTLKFGLVGTVLVQAWKGTDASFPYFVGSGSGALYLYLLGKKVDTLGSTETVGGTAIIDTKRSTQDSTLGSFRFFVPLMMVGLLAAKNKFVDGGDVTAFHLLDTEQFLPAIFGFLTYRVALFATEVATDITSDDWLSFLPGSLAEGFRLRKKLEEQQAIKASATANSLGLMTTVVFVTGPRAAGRTTIAPKLGGSLKTKKMKSVKFITTDEKAVIAYPERYRLVSKAQLDLMRENEGLIFEGEEKSAFGSTVVVAVDRMDLQLTALEAEKTALLIEGPPQVLDALRKVSSFRLINVWISLQTKEQFIEKASQLVEKDALTEMLGNLGDKESLAQRSATQVSDLVNEAARDITYYMQKAPLFEYTLLNLGKEDETVEELDQLLKETI